MGTGAERKKSNSIETEDIRKRAKMLVLMSENISFLFTR